MKKMLRYKKKKMNDVNTILKNNLLTTKEASNISKISEKQLIRMVKNKKLHCFYIGKVYRFNIKDILTLL